MIYYFTGQPGHGKTTLAVKLKDYLSKTNSVFHIDGDDIRKLLNNQNYEKSGRIQNIRTAQNIARYLDNLNHDVIISLVAPYREIRNEIKSNNVIEIYVHCDEIRGREKFHAIDYEPPTENYIDIDTTNKSIDDTFNELIIQLTK